MDERILLIHRDHMVIDHEHQGAVHRLRAGTSVSLPEQLALAVADRHPSKVCLLREGKDPEVHKCKTMAKVAEEAENAVEDTAVHTPDENKMMNNPRLSPQRRKLLRGARGRSRRARLENAHIA